MGTETVLLMQQGAGVAAGGLQSHYQHQHQQHNYVNAHPQPYQIDGGGGAFGDSVKITGDTNSPLHPDVFGNNYHHNTHSYPGTVSKFPTPVGIYRPPAARRALKLAENTSHQLAPAAACENPSDYAQLTSSTTSAPGQLHSVQLPVNSTDPLAGPAHSTTDKVVRAAAASACSLPHSTRGSSIGKDQVETGEKTGSQLQTLHCSTTSGSSSKCATQVSQTIPDTSDRALGSVVSGSTTDALVVSSANARINRPHRERRPDRAVYIPRARRSLTTPPVTTSTSVSVAADTLETVTNASSIAPASTVSATEGLSRVALNRTQLLVKESSTIGVSSNPIVSSEETVGSRREDEGKLKSPTTAAIVASSVELFPVNGKLQSNKSILICDTVIEELPNKRRTTSLGGHNFSVDAFKKRSYSLEERDHQSKALLLVDNDARKDRLQILSEASCVPYLPKQQQQQQQSPGEESFNASCDSHEPVPQKTLAVRHSEEILCKGFQPIAIETSDTMHRNTNRTRNAKNVTSMTTATNMIITDRHTDEEKIDRDEKELRRASQEMNRSNRRIMKQTFNSDVLEIDEPAPSPTAPLGLAIKIEKKTLQNGDSMVHDPAAAIGRTIGDSANEKVSDDDEPGDEDEDWESMYDDNGDCLNPKQLEELTTAVGKVAIEVPHSDYKAYQTKQAVLNDEEFPHVLEVSNFPAEFKTQDLMMLFSQYKESGFDIKWVDDTHALAVFSSSKIAAEVLATAHSFAQVKPLAEATSESRSKARKCASSLQPYRARPETCAALARRLVTTALGVRLKTAPEERENERRVLREAKERKLLAAKQRDEVWDS